LKYHSSLSESTGLDKTVLIDSKLILMVAIAQAHRPATSKIQISNYVLFTKSDK